MGLPDEESLGGAGFVACCFSGRGFKFCVFETGGEAGVDLVVPAAAHTPAGFPVFADDFADDLVGGGGFPAAGLEVEGAEFAGGVVFDFHGAVVVDGGGARDDTDNGAGDFFPGVEFFAAGGGTEFEEPGAEGVDVEGFAVEFGFDG